MNPFSLMPRIAILVISMAWLSSQGLFLFPAMAVESGSPYPHEKIGPVSETKDPDPSAYEQVRMVAQSILDKLGIEYELAKLYASWLVGALIFAGLILIVMMLRSGTKKKKKHITSQNSTRLAPNKKNRSSAVDIKMPMPTTDKEQVLAFFLQLFKLQVGALPNAVTRLRLIESRPTCPSDTYEMRVKIGKDWASRRMSLGLLGQGGGSRSKCFYVIFDSHMVLKLPTKAIPEFSAYRQRIKAEAKIVEQLYPRQCIVPRMAVILKAIYAIEGSENLSEDVQENKYVHLLEINPEYQEYLKIGPSFAFFMDLSKHFFLSTTLEEIHRSDQRIVHEALKQQELLWDRNAFVCRYGEKAGAVCHDLQHAYHRSEERLRQIVKEAQLMVDVPAFQMKQWFLTHLAGERVDAAAEDMPEELIERINQLLYIVLRENHQPVEQYRLRVQNYIKEMHFSQHRIQLENLASNTLDLLAWIDEKGLTLRDMKPENLFVAGQPEAYPIFLNDAKKFTIGLIDVETAVVMGSGKTSQIPQPLLAGTPLYATPCHLLSNTLLEKVYTDVRTILHMQDWYATIAIIYKIIVGKNLFSSTARAFPKMLKHIKTINPAEVDVARDMIPINQLFWNSAVAEFKEAIATDIDIFQRIEIVVPKTMVTDIVNSLHNGCDNISSVLAKTVSQQSVFSGKEKCQFLLDTPVEKIGTMIKKLIEEKPGRPQRNQQRDTAITVLERIENHKRRLQLKLEAAASLKTMSGVITADQLLEAMFERVLKTMYLPHWPIVKPVKWEERSNMRLDITTYQATLDQTEND